MAEINNNKPNLHNDTSSDNTPVNPVNKNKFIPNSKYFTILIYALLFVLGTTLIVIFVGNFGQTLKLIGSLLKLTAPFIGGLFIAFILYPLVKFFFYKVYMGLLKLKSEKLAKWLSIISAYICAAAAIAILCIFVIPQIYSSIIEITNQLPIWYDGAVKFITNFEHNNPEIASIVDFQQINEYFDALLPKVIDYLSSIASDVIPKVFSTSFAIISGVLDCIIAVMVSIYMLADYRNLFYQGKRLLFCIFPKNNADTMRKIIIESSRIFSNFIYGKALDSLIIGILCFIGMNIFKFPFAVLVSVIVGITNMIPFFGPFIGGFIGCLFIIIVSPIQAVLFAVLVFVLQQFDGLFLGPHILGDRVGIQPLWVIFSITIGGSLFGILGMFLGVPCFAVITYIANLVVEHFLKKKDITIKPYDSQDKM